MCVYNFPKYFSPKLNPVAWLEFEFVRYSFVVKHISYWDSSEI